MQRIQGPTAVTSNPGVPALTGPAGFFTGGNPAAGTPATIVPDWWLNMTQEEIFGVVAAAGLPPSAADMTQLLQALRILFGGGGVIAASGWQRLTGGLIIQWGTGNTITGQQDLFAFPVAFPTAAFICLAGERNASGWESNGQIIPRNFGVTNMTRTGYRLTCAATVNGQSSFAGSTAFFFLALGV